MIIRDNFCQFCKKTYVVNPYWNRLDETVQIRGHNIWFQEKKEKLSLNCHQILLFSRALPNVPV